ncbi:acyl-coenzyme A thioesterase 13-like [Ptychodera flava]|uniref:acyl-coenzyme A thioesterase 13-like n=1 Tax=Ptychodera flava TaxID=63121 RepID=UPI00396A12CC
MASAAGNSLLQSVRQIFKYLTSGPGFDKVMKTARVVSAEPGRCKFEMKVEPDHTNRGGTLHGGLTATVIDTVTTAALMTAEGGSPGVSVDLNVTYIRAAKEGETVTFDGRVSKLGKRLAFTTCDVTNESGALIAQGRHTKYVGGS